ncbi:X-ray repair cross-complementing protein 6-like isoform X1 [Hylaeus volcanicus]|uniref:X-ray repair cross-complementing protein 6-like isoform X1 n=1 Tax=Hylaeus volcanicus TaxID=313075 RepID=UPI0023B86D19|nr:X-ray repair cross-complementing protein 6-like isoform X1 [Hylaeus volcanicus]
MASSIDEIFDDEDDLSEGTNELYGIRDGVLFIIDTTTPMFENDPHEGIPYFVQCIRQYIEILKQKLVWNRQDWMGLILFGTKKWDEDSKIKHVLTLQKLNLVSVDNLKEAIKIEGGQWQYYKDIASSTAYPLHDVLWHAARAFSSIDVTMPRRRVIFFTCQDDPCMTNNDEKHRIRVNVTSYSDLGIQLFVVGLSDNWNHDLFYKDLEILSTKIDTDDYKRTSLKDLVEQVKLPCRNMAKLPWRLGENVTIDVSIFNLSVKTQYLKKEWISKIANTPLTSHSYYKIANDDIEDEENDRVPTPILETEIQKYQEFGNKKICFTLAEVKSLSAIREPGIDLICVKPIYYHPLYHFGQPYFVAPAKSNRKDNKLLFGAFINKCDSRNLMLVCSVTMRKHSSPKLYTMIPNTKNGGFYLYRLPFREHVRKLGEFSLKYMYDNNDNKPPADSKKVELLQAMIKRLRIQYDPTLFSNPKLQAQLQTVETLALDLEQREPLPDDTLPRDDEMRELVKDSLHKYNEILNEEVEGEGVSDAPLAKKRKQNSEAIAKPAALDKESIRKLVEQGKINSATVPQLKSMLKTLGGKVYGRKEELINRIQAAIDFD